MKPIVHQCCGCSCHVCEKGHNTNNVPGKSHTTECQERLLKESKK